MRMEMMSEPGCLLGMIAILVFNGLMVLPREHERCKIDSCVLNPD